LRLAHNRQNGRHTLRVGIAWRRVDASAHNARKPWRKLKRDAQQRERVV